MKKIRTILIVDSSKSDASSLNKFLRAEGFSTIVATDVQEATVACISKVIDLIVLELNLSGKDGSFLIENVRSFSKRLPIIIVSSRTNVESKIMALGMGANDYLAKPYNSYELLARIKNQFRYFEVEEQNLFNNGYLTIDRDSNNIFLNGKEVHFTHFEFKILNLLAENLNKTVSATNIITYVWGPDGNDQNGLRVFMAGIRRKIEKECGDSRILRTDVGVGYRMITYSKDI